MKSFQTKIEMRYRKRIGFTLVELLLVMAIIGVLSSLALVVVNEAQYDAKVSATRSRITMLDQIMRQRMEIVQEMRLPFDPSVYLENGNRRIARIVRRRIIADILNAEMPRSYFNVAYEPSTGDNRHCTFPSASLSKWLVNANDEGVDDGAGLRDELAQHPPSNVRRFIFYPDDHPNNPPYDIPTAYPEGRELVNQGDDDAFAFDPNNPETLDANDFEKLTTVSEYLYVILQSTQFNGISAIEAMGNRAFADTDEDGFPEVVDSWGNPIGFQFELYFNNGNPVPDPDNENLPMDLNFALAQLTIEPEIFDLENIKIRLISTGGRRSLTEPSRELITN